MARTAEIQVTPEEVRFLRRFFRRQALPWVVALGLVAVSAARWTAPEADPGLEVRLGETLAAIDALRAENAALRTQLDAVGQRMQAALEKRPSGPSGQELSGVIDRVTTLEERLASTGSAHDGVLRRSLARLEELEERMGAVEGASAPVPAAIAP